MQISDFISVGEDIHCTRVYRVDGKFVKPGDGGKYAISYKTPGGETKNLPVPDSFLEGADWQSGKVKHTAVAISQGVGGDAKEAGIDFIQSLARRQEEAGATYLDLNVDEYSTDIDERARLMKWLIETVQPVVSIPMSIDSSNIDILRSGLAACDPSRGKPMLNSVSLERVEAIGLAKEFNAVVIASAAGKSDLPVEPDDRMANIDSIIAKLKDAGLKLGDIHVDPLVFPISTDGQNGNKFIDTVRKVRKKYGEEIHIVAGLSNISFGMPNRKLIGQVFAYMCVEAGADGGIVDPFHISVPELNAIDPESEGFRLAKALLTGEDDFGMNFITACREGNI